MGLCRPYGTGSLVAKEKSMSYVKSNLVDGEIVVYETRLHWIVMIGHVIVGCLLLISGTLLLYYALSQTELDSNTLHIMEGGASALVAAAC